MIDVPAPKSLTEGEIKAKQKEQEILAKKFPPLRDAQVIRAEGIIKEVEAVAPELRTQFQLEDYAEALAYLGRFEEAAKHDKSEYYLSFHNANSSECACLPMTIRAHENGKVIVKTISHQFPLKEFVSTRGSAVILKCNKCGHLRCVDKP